jgi:membrane protein YdbS with pleckstrin-like domain
MTTIQEAIKAYKSGDKTTAYQLFHQAAVLNENDLTAWLGLAATTPSSVEKAAAYQHVIRQDPTNTAAMKGLAKMIAQNEVTVSPATQTKTPIPPLPQNQDRPAERVIFSIRPTFTIVILRIVVMLAVILFLGIYATNVSGSLGFIEGLAVVIFGLLFLVAIIASIFALITYYFIHYTLSTQNLVIESGILGKSRRTIPVQRIQDVSFNQSWLERLLNIGDILVESAGGFGVIKLKEVADYQKRIQQLSQLIDQQQANSGLGSP